MQPIHHYKARVEANGEIVVRRVGPPIQWNIIWMLGVLTYIAHYKGRIVLEANDCLFYAAFVLVLDLLFYFLTPPIAMWWCRRKQARAKKTV